MTEAPVIEAIDLRKGFNGREVLRGLSFAVPKGVRLVIMGGSGAGKTVCLRLIAGLLRPDAGQIRGLGRKIEPEVMLFDEPTAGLDPTNSKMVAELIAKLGTGVCDTAVVVTHDIELANTVADRVAILIDGRFAATGTPEQVRSSGDPAVQAFLTGEAR